MGADESSGRAEPWTFRVIKGGSLGSSAHFVRAANRHTFDSGDLREDLGVRCAEFRTDEVERGGERD